jgi:hypothetical protein
MASPAQVGVPLMVERAVVRGPSPAMGAQPSLWGGRKVVVRCPLTSLHRRGSEHADPFTTFDPAEPLVAGLEIPPNVAAAAVQQPLGLLALLDRR